MGFKNIEGQLARWIEELAVYNMEIVHRPGKDHVNADGLSRIPDPLLQCNYYSYGCDVQDLTCGGCKYCVRANEQWDRFHEEVDDIVPLAVRHISQDKSDTPLLYPRTAGRLGSTSGHCRYGGKVNR